MRSRDFMWRSRLVLVAAAALLLACVVPTTATMQPLPPPPPAEPAPPAPNASRISATVLAVEIERLVLGGGTQEGRARAVYTLAVETSEPADPDLDSLAEPGTEIRAVFSFVEGCPVRDGRVTAVVSLVSYTDEIPWSITEIAPEP